MIQTVNPTTGLPLADYPEHDGAEIERRLELATGAHRSWRETSFEERARLMTALAALLGTRRDDCARLMTLEMGKPITAAEAEVEKCAWVCRHYAENAAEILRPRMVSTDASKSYVRFDPLGPVLAVMPWNFPYWQLFRFAAPALMAGNTALLKHASNVTGCALAIEALFTEAGFPPGVFQTLVVRPPVIPRIISDDRVMAATLTGSEPAGRAVASAAGDAIKKVVLELGGSDPFVVLADADLGAAAETAAKARMVNSGQSCIAAKRFIVDRSVLDAFLERFVSHVNGLTVGDPLDPKTQVGPMAREDLLDDLDRQVRSSVAAGARAVLGGSRIEGAGFFFQPTVLADVKADHAAAAEETFGPVAAVLTAEGEDEAIRMANQTRFGLGATIFTRDLERAERLAERIDAGSVFVNGMVKSDPRLPFGGVKKSGYGRELSEEGLREFVNVKTVWIG